MAKVKGGTVSVEIMLDKDQFDKDFKAAQREVASVQRQLSLEMERNKVKFAVDGVDKNWVDSMFGNTAIGKIRNARREVEFLNQQIGFQRNKTDVAKLAWESLSASKGKTAAATATAERAFLREQMALVGLKKQLDGTATSTDVMISSLKNTAVTAAAVASAIAAAYATMAKAATEWGQSVNDIVDATGMGDEAAAKLLGTMNIVGLSTEDATGALVKMARSVDTAFKAQAAAAKTGKDSEDVFTRFGIAIRDSSGNLLDQATILSNIQTVHAGMRDGLEKTALEMEIFGRSGYKMNDFLNLSKEQMTEYTQRIEKMGLAVKDSAQYENLNKQLNEMKLAFTGIAVTLTGDSIPALTQLVRKLSEASEWFAKNKEVWAEITGSGLTAGKVITYPIIKSLELAGDAIKKYVELRKKELDENKAPASETDFVDRQAQSLKSAEALQKKQTDINRAKAAAEKDLVFAQRELQDAVLTLQGNTLAVTLRNIEREREAWVKKTKDEVAATQWAEQAKTKAFKDAIDARLGPEVAAAKKAILEGKNVGAAIAEAAEKRRDEEKATYEAREAVKKHYGIAESGDTVQKLQVDYVNNTITQIAEVVKKLTIPVDRNGRTVFDEYKPDQRRDMYTDANGARTNGIPQGERGSIYITVPVSIDGQEVGNAAAKVILPAVDSAVSQAQTQYGGKK